MQEMLKSCEDVMWRHVTQDDSAHFNTSPLLTPPGDCLLFHLSWEGCSSKSQWFKPVNSTTSDIKRTQAEALTPLCIVRPIKIYVVASFWRVFKLITQNIWQDFSFFHIRRVHRSRCERSCICGKSSIKIFFVAAYLINCLRWCH